MEEERRRREHEAASLLKKELNLEQLAALNTLEQFGWYLKFLRHQPPKPPLAVLCDPDKHEYAILGEFGELHENLVFEQFRQSNEA